MKEFVQGKIHNITVTDKHLDYHGSVTVCTDLLEQSNIEPYQKVDIINLNTGGRWTTYTVPGNKGDFILNGGGARLGEVNDRCVVIAYQTSETFQGAPVIFCDNENKIIERLKYER
jgi:aspartate 1-decarboxylase